MKQIALLIGFVLLLATGWLAFDWTVNRVYVPEGESLLLRYKGPFFMTAESAKQGHWAEEGQVGVRRQLRGPGRHFYSPVWWERQLVPDVVIEAGEVGVVTCLLGDALPKGEFLVPGDIGKTQFKGVLRKVLGPGRYRINPYGYKVTTVGSESTKSSNQTKHFGWVDIPTGYVGVITNLAKNDATGQEAGIQSDVLPPGLYPINGREQQIDIVEIGYRETTVAVKKLRHPDGSLQLDKAGEPMVGSEVEGINFPSSDGFPIHMDFTAVWGVMPDQAPHAVRTFGNIAAVENKVVQPQIESICRNNGSKYKAVEMLVGEDREKFQQTNLIEFKQVLNEKKITLLYGLVRHIYIPQEIREPIQFSNVADELSLTREQQQLTAKAEALYRQAERNVELESEKVKVDTERQFGSRLAEGDRQSKTIDAQTKRMVAGIEKETAELKAQATEVIGKATNSGKQMVEEAKADRFRLAVESFGSSEAYNDWIFAENLPAEIDLKLLYAGEGTLWTDMDNIGVRANVPLKKAKTDEK